MVWAIAEGRAAAAAIDTYLGGPPGCLPGHSHGYALTACLPVGCSVRGALSGRD
jgi:hypothetical protein